MTVIIVAPTIPDLPLIAEEAAALANALPRRILLQGEEATARGIINAIVELQGRGRSVAGFWFASHGSDEGVLVSTGMLDAISLASLLSTAGARWCVLNTCHSRTLVSAIQLRAAVDVVATEAEDIQDADAWEFARLLAIQYARTNDLKQSVALVARGSDRHRYYEHVQVRGNMSTERTPLEPLSNDEMIRFMYWRLTGDSLRNIPGLVDTVELMSRNMARMEKTQKQMSVRINSMEESIRRTSDTDNTRFWVFVIAVVIALSVIGYAAFT